MAKSYFCLLAFYRGPATSASTRAPYGSSVQEYHRGKYACARRGHQRDGLGAVPEPQAEQPPGGVYTESDGVAFGCSVSGHFLNVQALCEMPDDTLCVPGTGRPTTNLRAGQHGARRPKLVAVNLAATVEDWSQPGQHPSTLRVFEAVPSYHGLPFYSPREVILCSSGKKTLMALNSTNTAGKSTA
ncbi:hypothetical protein DL766_001223 [Monosporascus sp. MC13-8B]|uniref:Uncharacterized protein n=1 Tax=Monosporascus cannonballus TaxID=155416 RepID=A0ABY0HNJ6_9PEZI|nr:hypothetical protein DL762_000354 [Monosporascus cannonballus]RYO96935.1 hypothetical protein DL763_002972 [Monosporascus cannonballus]RYP37926.1 hypothetical protein DL766_001223 [Monosporascus sp. MC13-8B]